MTEFFRDLMKCLLSLKIERDHRALDVTLKKRVTGYTADSTLGQYMSLLTPYSFSFLKAQVEYADKVKIK